MWSSEANGCYMSCPALPTTQANSTAILARPKPDREIVKEKDFALLTSPTPTQRVGRISGSLG